MTRVRRRLRWACISRPSISLSVHLTVLAVYLDVRRDMAISYALVPTPGERFTRQAALYFLLPAAG